MLKKFWYKIKNLSWWVIVLLLILTVGVLAYTYWIFSGENKYAPKDFKGDPSLIDEKKLVRYYDLGLFWIWLKMKCRIS